MQEKELDRVEEERRKSASGSKKRGSKKKAKKKLSKDVGATLSPPLSPSSDIKDYEEMKKPKLVINKDYEPKNK